MKNENEIDVNFAQLLHLKEQVEIVNSNFKVFTKEGNIFERLNKFQPQGEKLLIEIGKLKYENEIKQKEKELEMLKYYSNKIPQN